MKKVPLSSLATIAAGQGAPKQNEFSAIGTPFVRAGNLEDLIAGKKESNLELVSEEIAQKRKLKLYPKGSILFAKSGMSATKGRIYVLQNPSYVVSHLAILVPNKEIHGEYLRLVLKQFPPSVLIKDPGYPAISLPEIQSYQVPLPDDADDQIRIAHLLSKVEGLIAQRKQHLQQLVDLLKSVFLEMFGDISDASRHSPLGEYIKVLTDYHANGSYKVLRENVELLSSPDYALIVRTTDLENHNFDSGCNYITKEAYEFLSKSKVYGGEIIINKIGSAGKVYLMPDLDRPVSLGMNAFLIRFTKNLTNKYAYYFLTSTYGASSIQKLVKGAVTKTITKDAIRSIKLPVPDILLQNQFAATVEKVEGIITRYQKSLTGLENLYGALSQKAFKGELDLSRVSLDLQQEDHEKEPVEVTGSEQGLPEEVKPTLENLNALNQSVARFKAIAEAARLPKLDLPQLDAVKRVAEQMAALQSPLQELKQMHAISQAVEQAHTALKPLNLEHMDVFSKSAELARAITSALPNIDLGWLEQHNEFLRKVTEPFETMREAMAQITIPSIKMLESVELASETAKRLQSAIPDFHAWQQQGTDAGLPDIDDEEETTRRPFTREDMTAIFAQAPVPLSFDSLLVQLDELAPVDLAGYETIRGILFALLEEQQLIQDFDDEKTLLLMAAP